MENLVIVLIVAAVVVAGGLSMKKHFGKKGGCCSSGTFREKKKLAHIAGKKTAVIEGMMCENCEARVERYLNEIPGAAARANHKKKCAIISYESTIDEQAIRNAVEKAGYTVTDIR